MKFLDRWLDRKVFGKYILVLKTRYVDLTNSDNAHSRVLKDRIAEIKRLQNELRVCRQLLDSSEQASRNYGNR
jgi:hypothetical protein